ncbi:Non-specific serine/threonine protein kinase [Handroanthus impetiginosus]|uniref:Non-specific serine/threonine protein kinase n=1 Tax=Handroanthus impetiginosus TaxID=429701 RepID=A0A2G9FX45_9LAMI|nr:Non-specific serine/threonine protein kinase [Handroanthus impetiginosus]
MEIAVGVAEGLDFLHDQPDTSVIFRNLKPSNVLLTLAHEEFLPKLSDFWLAKFGAEPKDDRLHLSTSIAGNSGYWAPEYMAGKISLKTDVYSFGILLLEIVTGRQAWKDNQVLVDWLHPRLRGGNIVSIVDEALRGQFPAAMLDKVIQVALACIRRNPDSRPTMKDVTAVMDYVRSVKYNPGEGTSNAARRRRLMKVGGVMSSTTANRPETGVSLQIVELLNKDKGRGVAEAMKWASNRIERSISL